MYQLKFSMICYVWLSFIITFSSFSWEFRTMYFAHIHRIPTNPPGYTHLQTQQLSTFLLFFLVTQLQFVFLMYSQVWKVLLEVANLTHLLFMPECYFLSFTGTLKSTTSSVNSWVQWICHVQGVLLPSGPPCSLALIIFLSSLLWWLIYMLR